MWFMIEVELMFDFPVDLREAFLSIQPTYHITVHVHNFGISLNG